MMRSALKIHRYSFVTAILVCLSFSAIAPISAYAGGSIAAWGSNGNGRCTVPSPNTDFTAIVSGYYHSLGLKNDGSIVAWGLNGDGQCDVPSPNTGFTAIAAGRFFSLGLKADGSVVAWGSNEGGPCNIPSPNTGFTAIAAGAYHSLGLKNDGSIVAWGRNEEHQCNVPSQNENFKAIVAGELHSLGLKNDGSIVAWGSNGNGQCTVPSPNTGFTAIAAGAYHSLGLKNDGSIVAWGHNSFNQCNVPVPNTDFKAIAAGAYHSLGLKNDGSIVGWEENSSGELNIPSPNADFTAISTGEDFSLGLKVNNIGYGGGIGTANDPYLIYTAEQLNTIGTEQNDWDKCFKLMADVNMAAYTGTQYNVIANINTPFTGKFDGNNHVIRNFTYNSTANIYIGLFGYLSPGAEIKNLGLVDVNVSGKYFVGGLVGGNKGIITACYATGSVSGEYGIGGLLGLNGGALTACHAAGTVSGTDNIVGGLVGENIDNSILTDCYATSSVTGLSYSVGGLVGDNYKGTLTSCYATGTVSGKDLTGGLVGYNSLGVLTDCYATGMVNGTSSYTGGLVGKNENGTVTDCYATGSVSGSGVVGGLVGHNPGGTITSCYAAGSVIGAGNIGGLVGYNDFGNITACYATGSVSGTGDSVGGLVGGSQSGNITACHASNSVSGTGNHIGGLMGYNAGTATSCYATGSVNGPYNVGGLVGYLSYGTLTSCYATGAVSGQSDLGGLVGYSAESNITSCYATGSVNGTGNYIGGLACGIEGGSVTSSYSTGSVSGNYYVGGLTGYNNGTVTNCFWDTQTSGTTSSYGGIGKTTAEMKTLSTFTDAGWDFSATDGDAADWQMPNKKYPRLIWEQVPSIDYLPIIVQKCSLAAGKADMDSISIAGLFNAADSNFTKAMNGNVEVTIDSDTMPHPRTFIFQITPLTYKKGKFSGKITNTSFSFDTKKQKFSFAAKKTNLTGVSCPITVTITIGNYAAQTQLEEDIVNGKKSTPFQLMMGVQNNLTVTKYKLKPGKTAGTDTFTAQGIFTIDGTFDTTKKFVITIGSQTFTVPENSFFSKSGSFSCKNILTPEVGFVTAKLDTNKCTFALSITKANITQTGDVKFELDCFGNNLAGLETIDLN